VAWQWNTLQTSKNEASRPLSDYTTANMRLEDVRAEIEQLRSEAARLDGDLIGAKQTEARRTEAERQLTELKRRLHGLLTATDYRWPEDLPFVRVSRTAIENVNSHKGMLPFDTSGRLSIWVVELLGLSADERTLIESNLSPYLQQVDQLASSRAYETNSMPMPPGWMVKTIAVPGLGAERERLWGKFIDPIVRRLGQHPRGNQFTGFWLHSLRGFVSYPWIYDDAQRTRQSPQMLALAIKPDGTERPAYQLLWVGTRFRAGNLPVRDAIPNYLREHFEPWIRELGITGEIFSSQP